MMAMYKYLNRLLAMWVRIFKGILVHSIRVLTNASNKIDGLVERRVSSERLEADEILLFPLNEHPEIKQKKITIENETRNCLLTPVPVIFDRKLEIAKGDVLEFGIGVEKNAQVKSKGGFFFKVAFEDNKRGTHLLFSKYLNPSVLEEHRQWWDVTIDLSQYAGKDTRIIFKAEKANPKEKFDNDVKVAWSNPIIYNGYNSGKRDDMTVILISLDSLRPDHLSCYGYYRDTSPNIDNLAEEGILFENAISQTHWTLPAHMSIMTSLYPSTHKIYINRRLKRSKKIIAEILREQGFMCAGFATHMRLKPEFGFARGFDYYTFKEYDFGAKRATAEEVTLKAMNFLTENKDKKNFLFLHYFDIHAPYTPPGNYGIRFDMTYDGKVTGMDFKSFIKPINNIFATPKNDILERDLEHMIALYDGEIAHLDYYIGMLIKHLKNIHRYDNSLIILTGDHGEELREHESIAHNTLYDEVIKVPLIIKLPKWMKQKNKRIREVVQGSIDIFPTIEDILEIPSQPGLQGKSLLPLINDKKTALRDSYTEAYSERLSEWNTKEYGIAIRTLKYKYIYTTHFDITDFSNFQKSDEVKELYQLDIDPLETINLVDEKKELAQYFQKKIDNFIAHTLSNQKIDETEKISKKIKGLKSLGKI